MSEQSATTQQPRPVEDVTEPEHLTEPSEPATTAEVAEQASVAGARTADGESSPGSNEGDTGAAVPGEAAESVDSAESSHAEEGGDPGDSADSEGAGESSRVARLEREGEVAADFLEQLLDIADLDGDLDVDVDGDRAAVAIVDSDEGRVPRRLVGDHAKVLEALQELTRLAVQSATGERSRLMLDVAGYRADRRKVLVETARQAIEQVKSSGERTTLEPMTAFERKVVHDEVLAGGLASESEGVEPRRCVVVLPR